MKPEKQVCRGINNRKDKTNYCLNIFSSAFICEVDYLSSSLLMLGYYQPCSTHWKFKVVDNVIKLFLHENNHKSDFMAAQHHCNYFQLVVCMLSLFITVFLFVFWRFSKHFVLQQAQDSSVCHRFIGMTENSHKQALQLVISVYTTAE